MKTRTLVTTLLALFLQATVALCQQNNDPRGSWLGSRQIQAFSQCFDGLGNFLCGGDVTFPLTSDTIVAADGVSIYFGDGGANDGSIKWIDGTPIKRWVFSIGTHPDEDKAKYQFFTDNGGAYTINDYQIAAFFRPFIFASGQPVADGSDVSGLISWQPPTNLYSATGSGNQWSALDFDDAAGGSGSPANVTTHMMVIRGDFFDSVFNFNSFALGSIPNTVSTNPIFNAVSGAFVSCLDGDCATKYHTPLYASSGGTVPSTNELIRYDGSKLAASSPSVTTDGTEVLINPGRLRLSGTAFLSLPSASDGTIMFCSDCDPSSVPCTSAGAQSGNFAFRENGAWNCK